MNGNEFWRSGLLDRRQLLKGAAATAATLPFLAPSAARAEPKRGGHARFGIGDGYPRTLEEVGAVFKVTRERVRRSRSEIAV